MSQSAADRPKHLNFEGPLAGTQGACIYDMTLFLTSETLGLRSPQPTCRTAWPQFSLCCRASPHPAPAGSSPPHDCRYLLLSFNFNGSEEEGLGGRNSIPCTVRWIPTYGTSQDQNLVCRRETWGVPTSCRVNVRLSFPSTSTHGPLNQLQVTWESPCPPSLCA